MIPSTLTSIAENALFLQSNNNDVPTDFPMGLGLFLACGSIALFATISVIVWQLAATYRAKMSVAREEAYKELAHKTTIALERTASRLDEQSNTLSSMQSRVSEIERMLKDV